MIDCAFTCDFSDPNVLDMLGSLTTTDPNLAVGIQHA